MILLCGIPSEAPIALAAAAAAEAEIPHVVLNQREVSGWKLELELDRGLLGGVLRGPIGEWSLDRFSGVYVRLVEPGSLPGLGDPPDAVGLALAQALYQGLLAWLEVADCRVANRLTASASNASKPYQAQAIRAVGLRVPPTIVTNDPGEVRRFAAEHGQVIYKSTSSTRSIVRRLAPSRAGELDRVHHLPTQFQARIPGTDIRVHLAGEAVHATEIRSTATDYRYASRDGKEMRMEPCALPAEIAARCRRLSAALRLPFCGIDLRRTADGRWYCFEVNPSPAYSYFEQVSGQPIARALIEYLGAATASTERREEDRDGASD